MDLVPHHPPLPSTALTAPRELPAPAPTAAPMTARLAAGPHPVNPSRAQRTPLAPLNTRPRKAPSGRMPPPSRKNDARAAQGTPEPPAATTRPGSTTPP